jgi:zinc protease
MRSGGHRMVRSKLALVAALAACSTAPVDVVESVQSGGASTEPVAVDADVRIGTLDNGLTYYLRANDRPGDRAELRLVIDAGSVLEEPDQAGVAHFLEHMMFNGTAAYPKNELVDVLRGFGSDFGADINAYTSYDETVYELSVPAGDDTTAVDTGLDILHEWLGAATLHPDDVAAEVGVVLDEWRRDAGTGNELVFGAIERMFFAGSVYEGRNPIGDDEAITTMTPERMRRFYDRWYRPDNAAIVVVGDIDVDAVEQLVGERFADLAPRGDSTPRPDMPVAIAAEPRAEIVTAPDLTTAQVELTLPSIAEPFTTPAAARNQLLDGLAFSVLAARLDDDARRGIVPLLDGQVSSNSHIRPLDAPAVIASTEATELGAAIDAVLVEYERLRRLGVLPNELTRAATEIRTTVESRHDGRNTRQDVDFAEQYVTHFLTGAAIPDADTEYRLAIDALDSITAADVDAHFRARDAATAPHVLVIGPDSVASSIPSRDAILATIAELPEREIEPRADANAAPMELLVAPSPVVELSRDSGAASPEYYIEPVQLTFPNGARVVVNRTPISEGQVVLRAGSPGGTALLAPDDLPDAYAASDVVSTSGIGALDPVQLDQLLADRDVSLSPYLDVNEEGFFGAAASTDLETMFQLLHLYFAAPRFDPGALEVWRGGIEPVVDDPSSSVDDAAFDTLIRARYADAPHYRYLLSPAELDSVDLAGIERVWRERFDDPGDFTFAVSGDLDVEQTVELARTYIGSLPGTPGDEVTNDVEPAAPATIVEQAVQAGDGEGGQLIRLYTVAARGDATEAVLADLATEVVSNRLIDVVREQFGASYTPFATVRVTDAPRPAVETFVQVTGDPLRIAELAALIGQQLDDLHDGGATPEEIADGRAALAESYGFVTNEEIVQAVLEPAGVERFAGRESTLAAITDADVAAFLAVALPPDRYVQVSATPR